jgi:hypothetical protein
MHSPQWEFFVNSPTGFSSRDVPVRHIEAGLKENEISMRMQDHECQSHSDYSPIYEIQVVNDILISEVLRFLVTLRTLRIFNNIPENLEQIYV